MKPIRRIRAIAQAVRQNPRHLGVAGLMLFGGGAGTFAFGAQTAGATSNGYGEVPTTTTAVEGGYEECGTGTEMPQCTTTTTEPPTTTSTSTTTTTEPPTSTSTSTTTTTEPPTTTSTSTTTTTVPVVEPTCERFEEILAAEVDPDPFNAYWNAVLKFKTEFHDYFEAQNPNDPYGAAVHFIQEVCEQCPPEPTTTTTTTIPPTSTTTSTSTTTTTIPPTSTTTSTSTTTTTEPPTSTSTTSTTAVPVTSTTAPGSTTTAPPAVPAAPVPSVPVTTGSLPRTGAETDVLALLGGGSVVAGGGAMAAAARIKARNAADKLTGKDVAAGGPDPVDPSATEDIAVVSEPLTGDEIDATDIDALAADLVAEKDTTLYFEGENRIDSMKGNTKYSNVPDALLPASLRRNPEQTFPVRDTFEGFKFAPARFAERGL